MGLRLQETCCSTQVLKPWRSDQETSEENLFIKARQIPRQKQISIEIYEQSSTETESIEINEIIISRSDFWP